MDESILQKVLFFISRDDIPTCRFILKRYLDCFAMIVYNHHKESIYSSLEGYNKVLLQMILSKAMNIQKIIDGVSFGNDINKENSFIDPIVLYSITRNLYETICLFEVLNIIPKNKDQRELIFNLFIISGNKNLQKMVCDWVNEDIKQKAQHESEKTNDLEMQILKSDFYNSLAQDSKIEIENGMKNYRFRYYFDENNKIKSYGWNDVLKLIGIEGIMFHEIYNQLSIYAHPSYISVMQFGQMFVGENPQYKKSTIICMRHCFLLFSIFLTDYMKVFSKVKETYYTFSEEDRTLFETHYKMAKEVTPSNISKLNNL